jgi:hypothetical protein
MAVTGADRRRLFSVGRVAGPPVTLSALVVLPKVSPKLGQPDGPEQPRQLVDLTNEIQRNVIARELVSRNRVRS